MTRLTIAALALSATAMVASLWLALHREPERECRPVFVVVPGDIFL